MSLSAESKVKQQHDNSSEESAESTDEQEDNLKEEL